MAYSLQMVPAGVNREGPQRADYLPAEYRSGPFLSEAGSVIIPLPAPPAPRRRIGLRLRLGLPVVLTGLSLCALTLLFGRDQRLRDADAEARRSARLIQQILIAQPPAAFRSCADLSAAARPLLEQVKRDSGYDLALYSDSGRRILYSTLPADAGGLPCAPAIPAEVIAPLLEDSPPLLRQLALPEGRRLGAFIGLSARLQQPSPCQRLALLVLYDVASSPVSWATSSLVSSLAFGLPFRGDDLLLWALLSLGCLLPAAVFVPLRLSRPLRRLHDRVASLVPRGGADRSTDRSSSAAIALPSGLDRARVAALDDNLLHRGDELGDLGRSFVQLIDAMRENEGRLGARVRELTTLSAIGRAISSVLDLEEALRKIVSEVVAVFAARRGALVLVGPGMRYYVGASVRIDPSASEAVAALAEVLVRRGGRLRIDDLAKDPEMSAAARHGGLSGSLMAVPLDQQGRILGVLLITRSRGRQRFTESDLQLLATVADQASTAISNARLYDEVQRSSEDLELRVKERTLDLVMANQELARVVENLRQAQAQLLLSERLAGLGQLVAGVAHEINSPAAAIRGAADALDDNVTRMGQRTRQLAELPLSPAARADFLALSDQLISRLVTGVLPAPTQVRRRTRDWATELAKLAKPARPGVPGETTDVNTEINTEINNEELLDTCRVIAELDLPDPAVKQIVAAARLPGPANSGGDSRDPPDLCLPPLFAVSVMVGYLQQRAYLHRNAHAIRAAIGQITRIVGALKSYSHLDQAKVAPTDVHEGIETTLIILHSELKYGILLTRKYGKVPAIPAYVDELNQVWTNLLHNAVQALNERNDASAAKEIVIETGHSFTPPPPALSSISGGGLLSAGEANRMTPTGELPGLRLTGPLKLAAQDPSDPFAQAAQLAGMAGSAMAPATSPSTSPATSPSGTTPSSRSTPRLLARAAEAAAGAAGDPSGPVDGGYVWVAIEDNGPGIAKDVLPHIFEPFFTTKAKGEGTGLGLGIVQGIVTKHGGRIEVASRAGKTRFTVWLPVKGPAAARS